MKILMTIQSFFPCLRGPIINAFQISSELEKKGVDASILTTYFGAKGSPASERFDNVHVVRYKSQMRIMKYSVTLGLIKGLLQECDVIHSHEYRAFQSDLGLLMSKVRRKPFVIYTQGNLLVYKYVLKNKLKRAPYILHDMFTFRSAVRRADRVIVSSQVEYKDALDFGIEKKKIELIPMGVDVSLYEHDAKLAMPPEYLTEGDDNKLKLLFVGRLSPGRNLEPILYAIKDLPDIVFYIVGGELPTSGAALGYTEKLKALVAELGIGHRVKFIGQRSGKALIDWYKRADIFINTSKYESFGLAILEAAASNLPIISTPVGVASEIIKDGQTGFIVPEDPGLIARKLKELFSGKLRAEFGLGVKEIVKKDYDWNPIVDQYIQLYEKLVH